MAYLTQTLSRPRNRHSRTGLPGLLTLYRQRRALARLDNHLLRDIGVTDAEARSEADRPIWDVPHNWQF